MHKEAGKYLAKQEVFAYNAFMQDPVQTIFSDGLSSLSSVPFHSLGITVLDVIILFVVLFYAYEGYVLGFILALFDLLSFLVSFAVALKGYVFLGNLLVQFFAMPHGFANAIGFFVIALIAEVVSNVLIRKLYHKIRKNPRIEGLFSKNVEQADHFLGLLPGIISAGIILSFLFTVIISLPSSPILKQAVSQSRIASRLVTRAAAAEKTLNDVFGGALHETLNFLTIEPESGDTLALHFTVKEPLVDSSSEKDMLVLLNKERVSRGLTPLAVDVSLRSLARSYAEDMLQKGYFSHYNKEGLSPFDRMDKAAITYQSAGENLALAPSTDLSMQGLMNSPGHKANILSSAFGHVGIGVMDGGIYGKMFVQEFTD